MSEFKGTKGEVFEQQQMIQTKDEFICDIICLEDKFKANKNLIIDAFKVRQQINCELSELLEQRNEMLEMLISLEPHLRLNTQEEIEKWKSDKQLIAKNTKI